MLSFETLRLPLANSSSLIHCCLKLPLGSLECLCRTVWPAIAQWTGWFVADFFSGFPKNIWDDRANCCEHDALAFLLLETLHELIMISKKHHYIRVELASDCIMISKITAHSIQQANQIGQISLSVIIFKCPGHCSLPECHQPTHILSLFAQVHHLVLEAKKVKEYKLIRLNNSYCWYPRQLQQMKHHQCETGLPISKIDAKLAPVSRQYCLKVRGLSVP